LPGSGQCDIGTALATGQELCAERVTADLTVELVHRSAFSLGVAYRF